MVSWRGGRLLELVGGFRSGQRATVVEGHGVAVCWWSWQHWHSPAPVPLKGHGQWSGRQPEVEVTQTSRTWPAPPRQSLQLVSLSVRGAQGRSQAACPRLGSKEACPPAREGACPAASEEACPPLPGI